jgi:hypothetical protein
LAMPYAMDLLERTPVINIFLPDRKLILVLVKLRYLVF